MPGQSWPVPPCQVVAQAQYKGSRKVNVRFEYQEKSKAGFVELAEEGVLKGEEFFDRLQSAPDVAKVE